MPISFDDFIKKYKGKFVEYHSYGTGALNQCIDLVNQYFVEVLGVPAVIGTNAVDVPSKVSPNDFDYIKNTATNVPQKGDVIIWAGTWGHIAIFYEGDANSFVSFDENWPTGSTCQLVGHSYEKVLGWLHPKKEPMNDALTVCLADRAKFWKERDEALGKITELNATIGTLTKDKSEMDKELVKTKSELAQLQSKATEWNVISKMYEVDNAVDLDKIIRAFKEQIAVCQTSTNDTQVLDKYKQQVIELKKLSVKTVSKTTLIKELINRFTHK